MTLTPHEHVPVDEQGARNRLLRTPRKDRSLMSINEFSAMIGQSIAETRDLIRRGDILLPIVATTSVGGRGRYGKHWFHRESAESAAAAYRIRTSGRAPRSFDRGLREDQ